MCIVADNHIVLDHRSRVHDYAGANASIRIDSRPRHHHCPYTNSGGRSNNRLRVNGRRQLNSEYLTPLGYLLTDGVVPNTKGDRNVVFGCLLLKVSARSHDR